MMHRISAALLVIAFASAVPGQAQVPDYIRATPDAVRKAFGPEVAARIFSNAYTSLRQNMVFKSAKRIPGFDCPAEPLFALAFATPYPIKPGAVSWVEQYIVDCKPRTQRNFLAIVEDGRARMIELLPGVTVADPQLQRDAFTGSSAAVVTARPKNCETQWMTDTRVTTPRRGQDPWIERWSYDLCGVKAEVEMTFTPSARDGTSWGAKLVK